MISAKFSFIEVVRIDGRHDKDGQQMYTVTQSVSMTVTSPEKGTAEDGA